MKIPAFSVKITMIFFKNPGSGVQTGNGTPHDEYNIRGIAHARTNRKDDICMQRRLVQNLTFILEWGQGTCSLTKHTQHWAYSQYFHGRCPLGRGRHNVEKLFICVCVCVYVLDTFIKSQYKWSGQPGWFPE